MGRSGEIETDRCKNIEGSAMRRKAGQKRPMHCHVLVVEGERTRMVTGTPVQCWPQAMSTVLLVFSRLLSPGLSVSRSESLRSGSCQAAAPNVSASSRVRSGQEWEPGSVRDDRFQMRALRRRPNEVGRTYDFRSRATATVSQHRQLPGRYQRWLPSSAGELPHRRG